VLSFWFAIAATSSLNAQVVAGTDYSDRAHVDNTFDMAGQDQFGQRFASEHLTIKETDCHWPETGWLCGK